MKNEERKVGGSSTPPTTTHCELDALDRSKSDDFAQATIGFCPNEGPLPYKVIHEDNIPDMVGRVHSFDIGLAAKYGTNEAILIAHFQFWIGLNRAKEIHIHDGRCWTYQSRKDIQAQFPYWTEKEVRNLCDKLVNLSVLIKGNYSKNPLNRTVWYAFFNEKKFRVDGDCSNNLYKCPKGPIAKTILKPIENKQYSNNVSDWPQRANALAPLGTCYKDTDSNLTDKKKEQGGVSPSSNPLTSLPSSKKKSQQPKEEVAPRVMLDSVQQKSLLDKLGGSLELRQKCYEKLSDWKIGKNKTDCKSDYLAICNWVIGAVKDESLSSTAVGTNYYEKDKNLAIKIRTTFRLRKDIDVGYDYVEFDNGTNSIPTHLKFGSKDFTPNVLKEVRKRNLPTDGL